MVKLQFRSFEECGVGPPGSGVWLSIMGQIENYLLRLKPFNSEQIKD